MLRVSKLLIIASFSLIFSLRAHAQCGISVNAGEDVYRCLPASGPSQLMGEINGPYLNFNWSPTTGMSGSTTLSPTVTVNVTTHYVLTANTPDYGNNLVTNGDFEGGNTDFTSDYTYNPGNLVPEGVYDVLDDPQSAHSGFASCDDHTSGSGNMMCVNGAGTPNQNVWCQTVAVMPNTQYVLSAWVTSVVASSPARLQFNINGSPVGPIFNAPGSTCVWQQYFQVWNSAGNTSATICIVNQNTTLGGNDFALDDIVFAPVCAVTDTVTVHAINLAAIAAPPVVTLPCEGSPITISGNGSSTGPNIQYEWTTANGNIVSGENTLTPVVDQPGAYTLEVKYVVNGNEVCAKTVTVNVILNPSPISAWVTPPLPLGCGSPTTLLIGNSTQAAFSSYSWSTFDGNIVSGEDQKKLHGEPSGHVFPFGDEHHDRLHRDHRGVGNGNQRCARLQCQFKRDHHLCQHVSPAHWRRQFHRRKHQLCLEHSERSDNRPDQYPEHDSGRGRHLHLERHEHLKQLCFEGYGDRARQHYPTQRSGHPAPSNLLRS
jgi:hypothetical protein